jgi:spermidine synthase
VDRQKRLQATASFCTAATGFTMIGLEVLILLAFQAIYGYVYHQLAIVIAAFMTGTALGSLLALRPAAIVGPRALAFVQSLVALAPLLAYALFESVRRSGGANGALVILFPGVAFCAGLLGGYEFPLASRIFFVSGREHGTGILYAVDLAGAAVGSVLISAWLLPLFGFFQTALLMALVSMSPAALALWSRRESRP